MDQRARIRLRQKTQAWTRHMPEAPKRGEADRKWIYGGRVFPFESYHGGHYHEADDYYKKKVNLLMHMDKGGNLVNYEYEFWVGVDSDSSKWATCRWCGQECMSLEARKHHHQSQKLAMASNILQYGEQCTMQLRRSYAILKTREKCVACNALTKLTSWGIPLCGPKCRNLFRFGYNGVQSCLEEFKNDAIS